MIEEGVFKNEWSALCERFRMTGEKAPSQLMLRRYYRYLSARMDTETFRQACEVVYAEREFFPKPADFLEAVRPSEGQAMEAWDRVMQMARDWRRAKPSEVLDEAGQRALRQVGGVKRLAMTDTDNLPFRRREFLQAYEAGAASGSHAELPPMTDEGRDQLEKATADLHLLEGGR